MNHILAIVLYVICTALTSCSPIIIKKVKDQKYLYLGLIFLTMYISSTIGIQIFDKDPKYAFEPKNVGFSTLSISRSLSKIFSIANLPVSISTPIGKLSTAFSFLFDKLLYGASLNTFQYISIALLFLGSVIVNFDKILSSKSSSTFSTIYIIAIIALLGSAIASGYLMNVFYRMERDHGSLETINVDSMIGTFLFLIIYPIMVYQGYFKIPSLQTFLLLLFTVIFFILIPIYVKFYLYYDVSAKESIVISSAGVIFSVILGAIFLNEKITFWKISGLVTVVAGILLYIFGNDIKKLMDHEHH